MLSRVQLQATSQTAVNRRVTLVTPTVNSVAQHTAARHMWYPKVTFLQQTAAVKGAHRMASPAQVGILGLKLQ
jgi:hypothetical protein